MDAETQLDALGSVGIQNGKITAVSREPLAGPRIAQREARLIASKEKHMPL